MPTYTVTDPTTKQTVKLTGDSPPTEAELADVFAKLPKPAPEASTFASRNPKTAQVIASAANALPAAGAILGGVAASPETLGAGSVAGAALGAGAGRAARDSINEVMGTEAQRSPMEKAGNIATDAAVTGVTAAATPGLVEAAKTPIKSITEFAETYKKLLPSWLQPQFLADLGAATTKSAPETTMAKPAWQTRTPPSWQPAIDALIDKLKNPAIANNPQARAAIETAIRARGGVIP